MRSLRYRRQRNRQRVGQGPGRGKEQSIWIQASGGLSEADIQKMVKKAEVHAEEDKRRKALVEARNQADAAIDSTENADAVSLDAAMQGIKDLSSLGGKAAPGPQSRQQDC